MSGIFILLYNKERRCAVNPGVIGTVGHTVRRKAPKVRLNGFHEHCRSFVVRYFALRLHKSQASCLLSYS